MDSPSVRDLWADRVAAALGELLRRLATESAGGAQRGGEDSTAAGANSLSTYREALASFVPLLEEGRRVSGVGSELPEQTARFALGGASSLIFDEFRAGRGAELEGILPQLVFAVTLPYLGGEAAEAEMRRIQS